MMLQRKPIADQNPLTTGRRQLTTFRKTILRPLTTNCRRNIVRGCKKVGDRSLRACVCVYVWPCQYWQYAVVMHNYVKCSYIFIMFLENLLIFNVAVNLKAVGNQSANGHQLLGDRLKTRKTFYRAVTGCYRFWSAGGFCTCIKNLSTTSDNQLPNIRFERL